MLFYLNFAPSLFSGCIYSQFAGFGEYVDTEIGRLIRAIEATGELDNTLIFYIVGDNGASAEADDLVETPVRYADGYVHLNELPGLGVVLDEDKVARYAAN